MGPESAKLKQTTIKSRSKGWHISMILSRKTAAEQFKSDKLEEGNEAKVVKRPGGFAVKWRKICNSGKQRRRST